MCNYHLISSQLYVHCLSCFLAKFSHLILTEGTSTAGLTLMSVLNSATAQAFSPSKEKWPRGCYGFSSSLVWMREVDHKKGWSVKNWCFQTVVLEKTLEYPLDCKEIKPVNPEGNQSWIFIERTNAEAVAPILWSPDAENWLISKDSDNGKDWRQEYNRGWDGLMASLTRWTWVWASSGRWWRTAKPGILQSMGSQRVRRLSNRQQIMWYWLCVQFVIKVKN